MIQKLVSVLLLLLLCASGKAQLNIQEITSSRIAHEYSLVYEFLCDSWQSMELNGKVKRITRLHYLVPEDDPTLSAEEKGKEVLSHISTMYFDPAGRLYKKETDYRYPIENWIIDSIRFVNPKSLHTACRILQVGKEEPYQILRFDFEFENERLMAVWSTTNDDTRRPYLQFSYSDNGKVTQAESIAKSNEKGQITQSIVYNYLYRDNRLDTIMQYAKTLNLETGVTEISDRNVYAIFKYDLNPNRLLYIEGEKMLRLEFEYDEQGNLSRERLLNNYGNFYPTREIKYLPLNGQIMAYEETIYDFPKDEKGQTIPNDPKPTGKTVTEYVGNGHVMRIDRYALNEDGKASLTSTSKGMIFNDQHANIGYYTLRNEKDTLILSDTYQIEYYE